MAINPDQQARPGERIGELLALVERSLVDDGVDPVAAKGFAYGIIARFAKYYGPGKVHVASLEYLLETVPPPGANKKKRRRISHLTRF